MIKKKKGESSAGFWWPVMGCLVPILLSRYFINFEPQEKALEEKGGGEERQSGLSLPLSFHLLVFFSFMPPLIRLQARAPAVASLDVAWTWKCKWERREGRRKGRRERGREEAT